MSRLCCTARWGNIWYERLSTWVSNGRDSSLEEAGGQSETCGWVLGADWVTGWMKEWVLRGLRCVNLSDILPGWTLSRAFFV